MKAMGLDTILFCVQFVFGLFVYWLIAYLFALPRLKLLPWKRALLILTVPHTFRFLGLYALTVAAYNPTVSQDWANATAYGDLATQVFAVLTLIALHFDLGVGTVFAWVCHILGIYAFLDSTYKIVATQMPIHLLYSAWFLPVFYVPVLIWSSIYAFRLLIRHRI